MRDLYKNLVRDYLQRYEKAKKFLESVDEKIEELENCKSPKVITKYGFSVGGSNVSMEDLILNINAEIDVLERNKILNQKIVNDIKLSTEDMKAEEREITFGIYGSNKRDGKVYDLMDKYGYEKSHMYRIANEGLKHISLRLYGDY